MSDFIQPVLTIAGGAFFGPWGAMAGSFIGGLVAGGMAEDIEGPRLNDLRISSSTYGIDIPEIWGTVRVSGNVIWAEDITEHQHEEEAGKGGGPEVVTYSYTGCWLVALADTTFTGEMMWIKRVWFNGRLVIDLEPCSADGSISNEVPGYELYQKLTILRGETDHEPLSRIEAKEGVGNVPGFKDTIIILFEDVDLTDDGNAIPSVEVEVVMKGCVSYDQCCPPTVPLAWATSNDPHFEDGEYSTVLITEGGAPGDKIWTVASIDYYFANGLQTIEGPGDIQILYTHDASSSTVVTVSDWCSQMGITSDFEGAVNGWCDSVPEVSWDPDLSSETITRNGSATVYVKDGLGPYTWSLTGTGFTFTGNGQTTIVGGPVQSIDADGTSCGACFITCTDGCANMTAGNLRNIDSGYWHTLCNGNCYPLDIHIPMDASGWLISETRYWNNQIQGAYKANVNSHYVFGDPVYNTPCATTVSELTGSNLYDYIVTQEWNGHTVSVACEIIYLENLGHTGFTNEAPCNYSWGTYSGYNDAWIIINMFPMQLYEWRCT